MIRTAFYQLQHSLLTDCIRAAREMTRVAPPRPAGARTRETDKRGVK